MLFLTASEHTEKMHDYFVVVLFSFFVANREKESVHEFGSRIGSKSAITWN